MIDDIKFELEITGKVNSKPIIYGKTTIKETQNYALTGKIYEDFEYNFEEEIPQNITKIKVIKIEKLN